MNASVSQARLGAALDHLNAPKNLAHTLELFLLCCKVDGLSPRTIQDYKDKIGRFVGFCSQDRMHIPAEVNATNIRLFLLKLQETCSPITVKDYYGYINRFFNWMVSEGILEQSPMSRMHPPRVPQKEISPFSADHIRQMLLLYSGDNFLALRNRAIILMFLDTGLRLSELANIRLSDLDIERGVIKVMGKGAKERFVRIGQATQRALLKYLLKRSDNHPCLWVSEERKPLNALGIQIMVRRLGKRARITGAKCSPHTFRHTFADLALRNGAQVFEVQSLLGHSTLTMTRRYAAKINSEYAIEGHRGTEKRRGFGPVDNFFRK